MAEEDHSNSFWPLGAYALGLMVMPDNLALSGQLAGQLGIFAPLILAGGMLVYFSYAGSYANLNVSLPHADRKNQTGRLRIGIWLAYYSLVIRMLATVLLATGLTVSSGFVFNEVFVYWFPNFAFAFILLAGLLGLRFLEKEYRNKAQLLFVGTVLLGLTILIAVGLTASLFQEKFPASQGQAPGMSALFLPLLLLLGFDIALYPAGNAASASPATTNSVKKAIAIFAGLMVFWVVTSLLHVDGRRLANSTIAHLIAAREIGGQVGRIIMGVMVIAGTCAALNALFEGVMRSMDNLSQQRMLPRKPVMPKIVLLLMAVVAASLMASGLAGEELLETLIRATLLMWMGKYGLITVRQLCGAGQSQPLKQAMPPNQNRFQLFVSALITVIGIAVLALTGDQPMFMFAIMILSIFTVFIFGGIHRLYKNRFR